MLATEVSERDDAHERHRRGTRQLLLGRGSFFLATYVVSAVAARQLGAVQYGIYGVIVTQLLWVETVVNAGIPGATSRLLASGRHDAAEVEASARALLLGLALLTVGVCWVLSQDIAQLMQITEGAPLFRLAALDIPLAAAYASYEGALYGHRRFGILAGAQIALSVLRLVGVLALFSAGFSVARILIVIIMSTLVVDVGVALYSRSLKIRVARSVARELVTVAAPMAVYLVFAQVLINLDLWWLKSIWTGAGEIVGQYVASGNLGRTLLVVPAVQGGVLLSSVAWAMAAHDLDRARRHIQEATRFAFIVAVAAFVILGSNGAAVISILFSADYAAGDRFLRLQLAGFGLYALVDAFCCALMAAGQQRLVAVTVLAIVPVVWLGNLVLIPRFGPIGAATSMVGGLALAAVITGALAWKRFGQVMRWATLLRVLLAAAVVEVVSDLFDVTGAAVLMKIAMLSLIYTCVLVAMRELTWSDFGLRMGKSALPTG